MTREEERRVSGVIRYIRRHIDVGEYKQIFNTRNRVGDVLRTVYADGSIILDVCDEWGYMEVFGLTDEAFDVVRKQLDMLIEDHERRIKVQRLANVFSPYTVKLLCENEDIDAILNDEGFLRLEEQLKKYRYFLTDKEYNALQEVSAISKMDTWFWLISDHKKGDYVVDSENGNIMNFKDAVHTLFEGITDYDWNLLKPEYREELISLSYKLFGENCIDVEGE